METGRSEDPHAGERKQGDNPSGKFPANLRDDKVRVMKTERSRARPPGPFFVTRCEARMNDTLFPSNGLLIAVGQLIRQNGLQKIWDSILLRCEEESDGTLAVRVLISNPDWGQPLQIACIRSRPHDPESLTPLACNLDHEELPGQIVKKLKDLLHRVSRRLRRRVARKRDPLLRARGSGKRLWSSERADDYMHRLRE